MRLLKPVLSLSVLFSFSYAINCSLVQNVKKWGEHYYTITANRLTWQQAVDFARESGGYLAIPNSAAENEFLKSLIPTPKYAWIGVYDPSYMSNYCYEGGSCLYDDSRFRDIKGNALTYTNWAINQPDNLVKTYDIVNGKQMVSPLGEHWVAMSSLNGKWADFGNHADEYNNPVKFYALIEFDKMPDCYTPPSNTNTTTSIQGKVCNTQIYDNSTNTLQKGETFKCLQDKYGTYYCPAALAPAKTYWDYDSGYSVGHNSKFKQNLGTANYIIQYTTCNKTDNQICVTLNDIQNIKLTIEYWSYSPLCRDHDILKVDSSSTGKTPTINLYYNNDTYNNLSKILLKAIGLKVNTIVDDSSLNKLLQKWWRNFSCEGVHYNPTSISIKANIQVIKKYYCNDGKLIEKNGKYYCEKTISYTYYEYFCSNEKNQYGETYEIIDKGGDCHPTSINDLKKTSNGYECNSPTPPANNCRRKAFTCNSNIRKPVWVDGKWQCSPFPCIGNSDIEVDDTPTGIDDVNNNGWNANGTCSGKIYIFNGKDMRCRSNDTFGGLTGGGCCDKDKVFLGLVECKEDEKILARKNDNGMCHYVGKYCSKKLKFLGGSVCIQHKKTYCCFNSKLARIINEQGRKQLNISWGTAKHPNCRGFTPQEFQKLDFSKMNLGEFYKQISQNISQNVLNNMTQYMKNSIENQLNTIQRK